jgi:hypothetical protein
MGAHISVSSGVADVSRRVELTGPLKDKTRFAGLQTCRSIRAKSRMSAVALLCAFVWPVSAIHPSKEKSPAVYKIPAPPKPNFSSLEWLVGEWSGKIGTKSPTGDVHLTAAYDLEQRFMVLREQVSLEATKSAPASKESWIGILNPQSEGRSWELRAYSSHGFITRYEVTTTGNEIHFNFEGGEQPPPGWLFRRVIQRVSATEITETVQVAPPDRPFFDYYSARLNRVIVNTQPAPLPLRR